MKMTAEEEAKRLAPLSANAKKLYHRINVSGRFYKEFGKKPTPKAMQELIDARLIQIGGRVALIVSCYVPVRGFQPCELESWPGLQ